MECKNCVPKKLGCFNHCGHLVLPMKAKKTGFHQFQFEFLGSWNTFNFYGIKGKNFSIPNKLNEKHRTIFQIIDPDGKVFRYYEIEELGFEAEQEEVDACTTCGDCAFSLQTRIMRDITCVAERSQSSCVSDTICYSPEIGSNHSLVNTVPEYMFFENGESYTLIDGSNVDGITVTTILAGNQAFPPTVDTGSGPQKIVQGYTATWNGALTGTWILQTNPGDQVALVITRKV